VDKKLSTSYPQGVENAALFFRDAKPKCLCYHRISSDDSAVLVFFFLGLLMLRIYTFICHFSHVPLFFLSSFKGLFLSFFLSFFFAFAKYINDDSDGEPGRGRGTRTGTETGEGEPGRRPGKGNQDGDGERGRRTRNQDGNQERRPGTENQEPGRKPGTENQDGDRGRKRFARFAGSPDSPNFNIRRLSTFFPHRVDKKLSTSYPQVIHIRR